MSPDVREKAEALAEALANSEEYKAFKEATEELDKHEAAKIMLRDFRTKQMALQQKTMMGENPTEAEVSALQQAYQLVAFNPYVRKVIEAEAAFSATLAEIQRLLAEAVGLEIPEMDSDESGEELQDSGAEKPSGLRVIGGKDRKDDPGSARSRLWVPGR